ncbi:MAG: hypothetical protein J6U54_04175 [Clostridiales bacterium]|nr:hypothetical protein [Clostridiales bacterium]
MKSMTRVNLNGLAKDISMFSSERNDNTLDRKAELLTYSKGAPIDAINDCLDSYNSFCDNLNRVYASTERYLEQALTNLQNVEQDNKIN